MASTKVLAFVACLAILSGSAMGGHPKPPPKPVPANSANAVQSNSVTGSYSGGSQPYADGGAIATADDGNSYNFGSVTSGNQGNQNGQGNSLSQSSTIGKRHLLGAPKPKPPPKPVPSNSANAIQSNSVTGAASGGSQPYAENGGFIFSEGNGNAENDAPVTSGNQGNQNGQGNSLGQSSTITGRRLQGAPKPKPPPKPVPSNSANAIQSNSVTGAASGGSQPYAENFGAIGTADDGNAYNYGAVTSGNQGNQNGQGNGLSQSSSIGRRLQGAPKPKPPPKPVPSNSANAIQSNSVTGAASGGSQPYADGGVISSFDDGNAFNDAPVTSGNQGNQNGQANSLSQSSSIGRRLQGAPKPKPPPKPVPVNSANAIQSNSVTGAASGGSQPYAENGGFIISEGNGNAENDAPVTSGNQGNQNGQGNGLSQSSSIGRRLQGAPKPKPPPKPVPVNSANAIQSNSVTGAASGGSQPYAENFGAISSFDDGNAENDAPVTSGNQGNQNGQGNSLGQSSKITGRRLQGAPKPKPPPQPVPVNSANAIQSNSVTGAASGGSQPYAADGAIVVSEDDGNAYNYGPVTSGNQGNQNGQGNSLGQSSTIKGRRLLGAPKPKPPPKPVPVNSANAVQSNSVTGAYSGGSQPYADGGVISSVEDGNAYNYGPVTSGNQGNQNGQGNSLSQGSSISG